MNLIERLLDAAPAAIMAHNVDYTILHVNREWARTFGGNKSVRSIIGTQLEEYYPRAAMLGMASRVEEVWKRGKSKDFDLTFGFPKGVRVFLMHEFPLYEDGKIIAVGSVATDITERRREQVRLAVERKRSDRLEAIGGLSAGVAHDFNNLLGIIDMQSAFARADRESYDQFDHDMTQIESAVKSGIDLVESLLTFGRRQPGKKEQVVVRTVACEMAEMFRRTMNVNVKIRTVYDSGPPWTVITDRTQLERAFINLVVNARDAMPDGGRLTISIEKKMERGFRFVKVVFADTGEGMSREVQQRVFEPFFTTKPKGKGSGLGLATVYGIVREMGGTIGVSSEIGKGTAFTLWLPALDPAEIEALNASSPSPHDASASSVNNLRVRRC